MDNNQFRPTTVKGINFLPAIDIESSDESLNAMLGQGHVIRACQMKELWSLLINDEVMPTAGLFGVMLSKPTIVGDPTRHYFHFVFGCVSSENHYSVTAIELHIRNSDEFSNIRYIVDFTSLLEYVKRYSQQVSSVRDDIPGLYMPPHNLGSPPYIGPPIPTFLPCFNMSRHPWPPNYMGQRNSMNGHFRPG